MDSDLSLNGKCFIYDKAEHHIKDYCVCMKPNSSKKDEVSNVNLTELDNNKY